MAAQSNRLEVLGPIAIGPSTDRAEVTNLRQRRMVVALFLAERGGLDHNALVDRMWDDGDRPENPVPAARTYANRLRRALAADAQPLVTRPGGYALEADLISVDATDFEALVMQERDEFDPGERALLLERALGLWRGSAFGDLADLDWVQPSATRLEELRLAAQETLLAARLDLGLHAEVAILQQLQTGL